MPFHDLNKTAVCPYCTLKMHCEKHKGQPYHGNIQSFSRPQDTKATLDKLYNDMVGSRLERFKLQDSIKNKEDKKEYWASVLEKKKHLATEKHISKSKKRKHLSKHHKHHSKKSKKRKKKDIDSTTSSSIDGYSSSHQDRISSKRSRSASPDKIKKRHKKLKADKF